MNSHWNCWKGEKLKILKKIIEIECIDFSNRIKIFRTFHCEKEGILSGIKQKFERFLNSSHSSAWKSSNYNIFVEGIVGGKCNVIASIIGRHTGGCDRVAGDYQSLYQQSIQQW